ncbi:hypothetical protein [Ruegeria sp. ANG-R]|uniref:hypothetical protein n=1 Tax=Ruegeria sp. ANG-R TaxID=1577903 RepID=UPI001269F5B0|nr:hypothetical protein [Ruegeria sp. ANG-R]
MSVPQHDGAPCLYHAARPSDRNLPEMLSAWVPESDGHVSAPVLMAPEGRDVNRPIRRDNAQQIRRDVGDPLAAQVAPQGYELVIASGIPERAKRFAGMGSNGWIGCWYDENI